MTSSSAYNRRGHPRRLLRWAIVADLLLLIALVVNYFRFEWFGITGNGSSNNLFNALFFIPMVFSALISYYVAGQILLNWKRLPVAKMKLLIFLMTAPIPIRFLAKIIQIARDHG